MIPTGNRNLCWIDAVSSPVLVRPQKDIRAARRPITQLLLRNAASMKVSIFLYLFILLHQVSAQRLSPIAYWTFDKTAPARDVANINELNIKNRAEIRSGNDATGNFLHLFPKPDNQINLVVLKEMNAFSAEMMVRFSPGSIKNHAVFFATSDHMIRTVMTADLIAFNTHILLASGEVRTHAFKIALDGIGRKSYGYYLDGNWHHFVFQINAQTGQKEIWIDGELPEGFSVDMGIRGGKICKAVQNCANALTFGQYFNGDIDEVALYATVLPQALIRQHYRQALSGQHYTFDVEASRNLSPNRPVAVEAGIDPREYAPGHPLVTTSATAQLRSFPLPRYLPNHSLRPLYNWMGQSYLGGKGQPGISQREAVNRSVQVQEELALNWHYMIGIENASFASSDRQLNDDDFYLAAWIKLANQYPHLPMSITTLWAQVPVQAIGEKIQKSYILRTDLPAAYYLKDAKGGFLSNQGTVSAKNRFISPAAPGELFKIDGNAQKYCLERILSKLNRPVQMINENGEMPPIPYNENTLVRDPAVVAHKKKLNIEDWSTYQAEQKLRLRQIYSSRFMKEIPQLRNTLFSWYGVDAGSTHRFDWRVSRKIGSPINGQYYATPDFYPRWPENWSRTRGAWRGWNWIEESRKKEILAGDRLYSPFVAAGWSVNPEENIRPSQWLALLKNLAVTGAEFYYTGFFNVSSGKEPVFPKPENYIWQAAMPAYAQAITSRYEDVLRKGNLLRDKAGNILVQHETGDPRVLVTVRKHDTRPVYVIAGSLQPISNQKGNVTDKKQVKIDLEGKPLIFEVRRQGSVYIYDQSDRNRPLFFQLDGWHETGHPSYWSQDISLEAELYDVGTGLVRSTDRPADAGPEDFSKFITYISAEKGTECVEYHFTLRENSPQNWKILLNATLSSGREGKIELLINGETPYGDICLNSQNWEWYEKDCRGRELRFYDLKPGNHRLTLTFRDTQARIDQIILKQLN